jgi:DNA polymerase-3 subunit delta
LIKLRDYVGGRPVRQADVRRLVHATRAANIFEMVDALASRQMAQAGRLLRHAIETDGEEPLGILSLLARRYRQLIQVKALQKAGVKPDQISQQIGAADWQVRRLLEQAGRQSQRGLHLALEHLLAADEAIKTGKCTDREAMDLLLAALARDAASAESAGGGR